MTLSFTKRRNPWQMTRNSRPFAEFIAVAVSSTAVAAVTFGGEIWKSADLPKSATTRAPIYSLVGQVASSWAHIDHLLDILIWQLADVDAQAGACITAQISGAYGRFRAVIALFKFHQQRTNKNLPRPGLRPRVSGKGGHHRVSDLKPSTGRNRPRFPAMTRKRLLVGLSSSQIHGDG